MLFDVTKPMYNGIPVWPGDIPYTRAARNDGDFSSSSVTMSLHTGTHMDAPSHRFKDGKTIDEIAPFIVPALVKCDGDPQGKAVLFGRPVNGREAEELVKSGAVLVGTTSISIDQDDSTEAHVAILGAGIPVIENLDLDRIVPGEYILMAFPLKFAGADGSPVRVLLASSASDIIRDERLNTMEEEEKKAHHKNAVNCFNATWDLLDRKDRSPEDNMKMIHNAHASCFHWGEIGTPLEFQRGEWQVSRVYAVIGHGEEALYHAQRCYDLCIKNGIDDFDMAFACEAMARAHHVLGDTGKRDVFLEMAEVASKKIEDRVKLEFFLGELSSVNRS